jgi:hypothetical protein
MISVNNDNKEYNSSLASAIHSLNSDPVQITQEEVRKRLLRAKKKSAGPDSYPSWVLFEFADTLSEPITKIFNESLKLGFVPLCFKKATIIPIPKAGCSTPEFRPISLLPHLAKVLEGIVIDHWLRPKILPSLGNDQYAFTGNVGGGTTNALLQVNNTVLKHLDPSSGASRLLLVDFAKAFDRAQSNCILLSLIKMGAPKDCVLWIQNFLSGRLQRVSLNSKTSSWKEVSSGVPQGSVLGPVLFAILIDSLRPVHPQSTYVKYADDITVIHNTRNASDDHLYLEWAAICKWSEINEMPINLKKTNVINVITKKGLTLLPMLRPDSTQIETVRSAKLLGVMITDDLKWNDHISYIVNRATKTVFILTTLKGMGVGHIILWQTYQALTRSILTYAFPAFCNLPDKLFRQLKKVENRAKKIIGVEPPIVLADFCDSICRGLAARIQGNTNHPLHNMFDKRHFSGRSSKVFTAPFAKTNRYRDSFIKYG